jgi:predicted metal-dependent hydrolase
MTKLFRLYLLHSSGKIAVMPQMKKLGYHLHIALSLDLPAELIAIIVATNHPKRLHDLFRKTSERLLKAHRDVLQRSSAATAKKERLRSKALLDLIRARIAAIGSRKPSVDGMLQLMDAKLPKNVIEIRKAA